MRKARLPWRSVFSLVLAAVLVGLPLLAATSVIGQQEKAPPRWSSRRMTGEQIEWAVFDLVNAERRKAGLRVLQWDPDLLLISRKHAEKMSREGVISHFEDGVIDLEARLRRGGFRRWSVVGENIARNRGHLNPAKAAMEKWLGSPGHRKNILDPRWEVAAVGVAIDRKGNYFLVNDFISFTQR